MSRRILVADDDPLFCKLLQFTLEQMGIDWEIVTVGTGNEAIAKLQADPHDLLVLDLKMPDGDGFSVLQMRREAGHEYPVVVVTHLHPDEHKERCHGLGAKTLVSKARLRMADMVSVIEEALA